jgi:hypothetical protein
MEKIMSKTKDAKKIGELTEDHRPLADSELDAVTGGIFREPTYHPAKVNTRHQAGYILGNSLRRPATDSHSPV